MQIILKQILIMFLSHLNHLLDFRSTSVAGVQGRKYWLMKKISISAVYISLSIATRAILAGALQGRFCPFREEACILNATVI